MSSPSPEDSSDWLPPVRPVYPASKPTPWRKVIWLTTLSALLVAVVGGAGWLVLRTPSSPSNARAAIITDTPLFPTATLIRPTATPYPPTWTPIPTAVQYPTPTLTALQQACGAGFGTDGNVQQTGNLLITDLTFSNVAYPAVKLADNLPLKPILAPDTSKQGGTANGHSFFYSFCNTSGSQSITVQQIIIKIVDFTPYSGTADTYQFCEGALDAATGGVVGGGCGGGYYTAYDGSATWPNTMATGTVLPVNVTYTAGSADPVLNPPDPHAASGNFPVTLKPHQSLFGAMSIDATARPGTAHVAIGVTLSDSSKVFGPVSGLFFFAPARQWGGQNCLAPAMRNQITAKTGSYICPPTP